MSLSGPLRAAVRRVGRYDLWLLTGVLVYFGVSLWLSRNRLLEFNTSNWDLGIFQQSLWSTGHGRLLWESGDFETSGVSSFLQVHPSFLSLALVPLYQLAPTPLTLFIVQSAFVAVAAFPLAALTRDLTRSQRSGLIIGGLYLAQASVLGANLYDFHIEAFLPLELFLLLLFWNRGRAVMVVVVAFLLMFTIEVGPVLIASVSLFLLYPDTFQLARVLLSRESQAKTRSRSKALREYMTWRGAHGVPFGLAMLAGAVVGYFALRLIQHELIPQFLGVPGLGSAAGAADPSSVGVSISNLGIGLLGKLLYWMLTLVLVALLPLRAPRTLIMVAPWAIYTLFVRSLAFTTLGFQYGFVAAPLVLVAAAYGARGLEFPPLANVLRRLIPRWRLTGSPFVTGSAAPSRPSVWVVLVIGAVTLNFIVSPIDPLMQRGLPSPAYQLDYFTGPGYTETVALAALVPPESSILASSHLFPLVANNVNAYSLPSSQLWTPFSGFNQTKPPMFVLLCQSELPLVPAWLARLVYSGAYGIRGVVWTTGKGTVLLFERGWTGATETWQLPPAVPMNLTPADLLVGPAGARVQGAGFVASQVIVSHPGLGGAIWYGPYTSLAAGNYTVTVELTSQLWDSSIALGTTGGVVEVQVGAFGVGNWVDTFYSLAQLGNGTLRQVVVPIHVTAAVANVEVRGYQINTNVITTMNYILIAPG